MDANGQVGWTLVCGLTVVLLATAACGSGDVDRAETPTNVAVATERLSVAPHFNDAPLIPDLVVYGDRTVTLGSFDHTVLGDIGVRSRAAAGSSPQLQIGNNTALSAFTSLISPSVSLGRLSTVGVVQTDALTNHGGLLVAQAGFPGDGMPAMPPAPAATPGATNVTVGAFQVSTLDPGNYGALNVTGTAYLNPAHTLSRA